MNKDNDFPVDGEKATSRVEIGDVADGIHSSNFAGRDLVLWGSNTEQPIHSYTEQMNALLKDGLCKSDAESGLRNSAHGLTRAILRALREDSKKKAQVVEFLYGAGLINRKTPVVVLADLDLQGADLEAAHIPDANLAGAILNEANLSGANLSRGDLSRAKLNEADLTGANLKEARLRATELVGAHLTDATLQYADLETSDLTYAVLAGADLSGATMSDCDLTKTDISDAKLISADLRNAVLYRSTMDRAKLNGADLEGAAEVLGKVKAGTGDLPLDEADIQEGWLYRFEVVGASMEHKNIYEGDYIVVRPSDVWPTEGDIIVTKYIPLTQGNADLTNFFEEDDAIVAEYMPHAKKIIGEPEFIGPTVKIYYRKVGNIVQLLGWEGDENKIIEAIAIRPIGKMVTTYTTQSGRTWEISMPASHAEDNGAADQ